MRDISELSPVCLRYQVAVELIGARWSGAILQALFAGHHRYADLRAVIPGISDTMLAQRLRELEGAGVIERQVVPGPPIRTAYSLTEKGRDLAPVIEALLEWSHKWIALPPGSSPDIHAESAV